MREHCEHERCEHEHEHRQHAEDERNELLEQEENADLLAMLARVGAIAANGAADRAAFSLHSVAMCLDVGAPP